MVSTNAKNYSADESNHTNKENYKIKGSIQSANARINNEKTVTDKENQDEELSYIVIYFGTTGNAEKASGMAITDINIYTATQIDNTQEYNFQEFEVGDMLTIDNSIPAVYLNDEERNDLIDVGSSFFALEPGDNVIKIASDDDVPNVDILWNNKYL